MARVTVDTRRDCVIALCLPALDVVTPEILARVLAAMKQTGLGVYCDTVQIALAEALNNIVEHAYRDMVFGSVSLSLERRTRDMKLRISDWGHALPAGCMTPAELPDPDSLSEGGYGWFLIRTLVSDLTYERHTRANHLTLIIRL